MSEVLTTANSPHRYTNYQLTKLALNLQFVCVCNLYLFIYSFETHSLKRRKKIE